MNTEYIIFLALYMAGLGIRVIYEVFKKAGKVDLQNMFVFGVVFAGMCIMWASWFSMAPVDPVRIALPDPVRWIGMGVTILGLILAVGGMVQLRGVENIAHLVTNGFFSKIRHPMYTGFIAWILGWSLYHGAIVSLAFGLVGIVNILDWRRLEEADLESRYGDIYLKYRARTWF